MTIVQDILNTGPVLLGRPRPLGRFCAVLRDGTRMSVQASSFHYSTPRDDTGPYTTVEVGTNVRIPAWEDRFDSGGSDGLLVYGYVSVERVEAEINARGGVAGYVPSIFSPPGEALVDLSLTGGIYTVDSI